MTEASERWHPIAGFEGRYDVSDQGHVRSWFASGGRPRQQPHVLKGLASSGYRRVTLTNGELRRVENVNILVLEAFVGPRPQRTGDVFDCRHLDGDRANNRLSNLAWGTRKENSADTVRHGRKPTGDDHWSHQHPEKVRRGEHHHNARFSDEVVAEVRRRVLAGEGPTAVGREFGMSGVHAMRIARGQSRE